MQIHRSPALLALFLATLGCSTGPEVARAQTPPDKASATSAAHAADALTTAPSAAAPHAGASKAVASAPGAVASAPSTVASASAAPAAPKFDPQPGASGIGDPLFPELGNGGYDVDDYDLTLHVDAAQSSLVAEAKIRAHATQDLSRFDLDFTGLEIDGLEVDGAAAQFTREGEPSATPADEGGKKTLAKGASELVITPPHALAKGSGFEVRVRYHGTPARIADPTVPFADGIGWIAHKGEIYVVSEPSGASSFFPVNDHPLDKATYTFRVTVKKPLVVAANGKLVETLDQGDETTYVWRSNDPMASYLATICIAEFVVDQSVSASGLQIVNFYTPSSKPKSREHFARNGDILAFYSQSFGPYPFESAGGILSSASIPGALETQTRPVYGAGVGSEDVIAHELAHMWFGDSVSLTRWQDIWLNEGFAEYAATLWTEHDKGKEKFEKQVYGYYKGMRLGKGSPPGNPSATQLFGSGVYVRGALTLHALRVEIGDEKFFALLQRWTKEHAHANASIDDFIALASDVAGRDMKEFLGHWLYDELMPSIGDWDARVEADRKARDEERARKKAEKAEKAAKEAEEKAKPKDGGGEKKSDG